MDFLNRQAAAWHEGLALMGAARKSSTPKCRQAAAYLVIDTGRTIAQVAREIGVGEACWGGGVAIGRPLLGDLPDALDVTGRPELERLGRENTGWGWIEVS